MTRILDGYDANGNPESRMATAAEESARVAAIARLRADYANLRQWVTDAASVNTNWSGTTYTATKDGQIRELFRRTGILLDRVGDLLVILNSDA